jgi:hypothetical protein
LGSSPSGQVLVALLGLSLSSPECWTGRKSALQSGVKAGPVSSACTGPLANW